MASLGTRAPRRKKKPPHTPLGFLVSALMLGTLTARTVIDRYFPGAIGARLATAIRFGTLTDGTLGPRSRPLYTRAAARMLASFLIHVEATDPDTMKGSGSCLWQGNQARRLQLSTTRGKNGTLGGTREIQRYARAFQAAGLLSLDQPDAMNVPDAMRGKIKESVVRGQKVAARWAYNVVRIPGRFSDAIAGLLRRWKHRDEIAAQAARAAQYEAETAALIARSTSTAEFLQGLLDVLRARPRPT